ncbi:undecaprenyl-phosphate glucose phosphotransferase [Halomonas sp. DN3]|uniref:undecaprenyl-phosphate glucose phosphotransferase n=1 Tax=Halomonas sp. DN3 TaxID=2953657 RepID=UPI00209E428E|nr:undecaprenyl-phosphate glucose phosphotransferase [Halomonas sp. DN3]USZ51572.1 undecaprenyl-phosphate glucose phosphotransferase [Halomonas sp. DN3]
MKTISGFAPYSHLAARLADFMAIVGGGLLGYWFRFGSLQMMVERYQWMILSAALLGMIVFSYVGIYRSWRGSVRIRLLVRILRAFSVLGAIIFAYLYFSKTGDRFSRQWLAYWLILSLVLCVSVRAAAYPLLNRIRLSGHNRKTIALIGDTTSCQTVLDRLRKDKSTGFDVVSLRLMDASNCDSIGLDDCRAFDPELDSTVHTDEVWICLPFSRGSVVESILGSLAHYTGNVRYMPDMQGLRLLNHDISSVAGLYLFDMSCSPMSGTAKFIKAAEDKVFAGLALFFLSPIMIIIAASIKLTSRGPVFYRQERMSWNGESFQMLKFRSMAVDSEAEGVRWGGANGKRVTAVGRFLRRSSLDELPQLINVIKGDMSLVGPRPERTMFVEKFKHEIPGYMQKHMVLAGITGWAQVHGWRGDTDLKARIEHDLWYIDNWSLWLDIKILILTVWRGFYHPHAR